MGVQRTHLNMGAWQERSLANGPGERFVLWLQGCPLLCPGCFNENLLPFVQRYVVNVEDMANKTLAVMVSKVSPTQVANRRLRHTDWHYSANDSASLV